MSRTCTLKGAPLKLDGPELKVGDTAPDAVLRKNLKEDCRLSEFRGKPHIYSVVPSLDTPVCAEQTRRFNKELAAIPNIDVITISCDLPVAMSRFCGAEGINTERLKTLSDHKELSFGRTYGVLIPDLRILCRAVFVVDSAGKLRYAEYVPEVADHPKYDEILKVARDMN